MRKRLLIQSLAPLLLAAVAGCGHSNLTSLGGEWAPGGQKEPPVQVAAESDDFHDVQSGIPDTDPDF